MDLYFYTPEQRRRDNGKIVTNVLQLMGGEGTAESLLKQISNWIGQPKQIVEPEVKQVLRRGVVSGFLVKRGRKYLITAPYQVDSGEKRKRKRSDSRPSSAESRHRTPSPRSPARPVRRRGLGATPFSRRLTGPSATAARLEAINQREREDEQREMERARHSYRQPVSPAKKRLKFAESPKSEIRASTRRSSQGSPKTSPLKFRKLNLDDDDDDDDVGVA